MEQLACWSVLREGSLHDGLYLMGTTYMPNYAIRGSIHLLIAQNGM